MTRLGHRGRYAGSFLDNRPKSTHLRIDQIWSQSFSVISFSGYSMPQGRNRPRPSPGWRSTSWVLCLVARISCRWYVWFLKCRPFPWRQLVWLIDYYARWLASPCIICASTPSTSNPWPMKSLLWNSLRRTAKGITTTYRSWTASLKRPRGWTPPWFVSRPQPSPPTRVGKRASLVPICPDVPFS